ncbi:MAG TPA: hypothetical protein VH206_09550 [Xanthobacteraceae bacterium]|nr:hypothetical protein [Xanthobacteraceae bacterium]
MVTETAVVRRNRLEAIIFRRQEQVWFGSKVESALYDVRACRLPCIRRLVCREPVNVQGEPMQVFCIVTGELINKDNDSKAHVIPSALGGRLKPKGIVSINGNGILDEKFDFPLVDAFQSLMNLLNGSRDRGDNQPTRMRDESGKEYIVRFGEPLELTRPEYLEGEEGGLSSITIKARTLKNVRTLLGRYKRKHPEFDIDEALKHAVVEHQ